MGAIAVIRLSGPGSLGVVDRFFKGAKPVVEQATHTLQLGYLKEEHTIDQVLVSVFKAPHSYTGEDLVELSCHGSPYIQREVLQLFLRHGVRMADAGEFTLRAFLNGKMDLSQAEAVADLIASDSAAAHRVALQQLRGGFSSEIQSLREALLDFAALIELELDFSEEDVAFADREALDRLLGQLETTVGGLLDSFALGNALKNGVPVAIIGAPNAGKSTLLNALLNEARAIVSSRAGTTRDAIEAQLVLDGVTYRFIDTAGLRDTTDEIERSGIEKTHEKIRQAQVVLILLDATQPIPPQRQRMRALQDSLKDKSVIEIINKIDLKTEGVPSDHLQSPYPTLALSAKERTGLEQLKTMLNRRLSNAELRPNDTLVSNARHYAALRDALENLQRARRALETNAGGELLAQDIRQALSHLGTITGQVTTEDLLDNIFANFCIGK